MVRWLNKQVAEDDITNMNTPSTDDLNDDLHKMTSWMHQMMSQVNQVVVTTPGQSQRLLMTSETVNLTKNLKALNKVTRCNTIMEKDSFLGSLLVLPVELWKYVPG